MLWDSCLSNTADKHISKRSSSFLKYVDGVWLSQTFEPVAQIGGWEFILLRGNIASQSDPHCDCEPPSLSCSLFSQKPIQLCGDKTLTYLDAQCLFLSVAPHSLFGRSGDLHTKIKIWNWLAKAWQWVECIIWKGSVSPFYPLPAPFTRRWESDAQEPINFLLPLAIHRDAFTWQALASRPVTIHTWAMQWFREGWVGRYDQRKVTK